VKQLNIFCEGVTEQAFCRRVLQAALFPEGSGIIHTLAVGVVNHHHVKGLGRGNRYPKVKEFIQQTIKAREGKSVWFSTIFDLYALPNDFPGCDQSSLNPSDPTPHVIAIEEALKANIGHHRFIPHIQLYEFETILFADPKAFELIPGIDSKHIELLEKIAASEPSIELIDDGPESAPSKRIIEVFPAYRGLKASSGPDLAEYIGLAKIREKCPHFDSWLKRLEAIVWED
jgi:hypothetical protein